MKESVANSCLAKTNRWRPIYAGRMVCFSSSTLRVVTKMGKSVAVRKWKQNENCVCKIYKPQEDENEKTIFLWKVDDWKPRAMGYSIPAPL